MDLALRPETTGLLLVDIQQKLCAAMAREPLDRAIRNWLTLVEMAGRLRLPVAVSEQYPQGLGPTLPVLHEALGRLSPPPRFFEKRAFSCCGVAGFDAFLTAGGRRAWLVAGMETHVCVWQTTRGLVERGLSVHVIADGCLSRTDDNRAIGLGLMARAGAAISSTETALFDLVGTAEGETFKALSRLVK